MANDNDLQTQPEKVRQPENQAGEAIVATDGSAALDTSAMPEPQEDVLVITPGVRVEEVLESTTATARETYSDEMSSGELAHLDRGAAAEELRSEAPRGTITRELDASDTQTPASSVEAKHDRLRHDGMEETLSLRASSSSSSASRAALEQEELQATAQSLATSQEREEKKRARRELRNSILERLRGKVNQVQIDQLEGVVEQLSQMRPQGGFSVSSPELVNLAHAIGLALGGSSGLLYLGNGNLASKDDVLEALADFLTEEAAEKLSESEIRALADLTYLHLTGMHIAQEAEARATENFKTNGNKRSDFGKRMGEDLRALQDLHPEMAAHPEHSQAIMGVYRQTVDRLVTERRALIDELSTRARRIGGLQGLRQAYGQNPIDPETGLRVDPADLTRQFFAENKAALDEIAGLADQFRDMIEQEAADKRLELAAHVLRFQGAAREVGLFCRHHGMKADAWLELRQALVRLGPDSMTEFEQYYLITTGTALQDVLRPYLGSEQVAELESVIAGDILRLKAAELMGLLRACKKGGEHEEEQALLTFYRTTDPQLLRQLEQALPNMFPSEVGNNFETYLASAVHFVNMRLKLLAYRSGNDALLDITVRQWNDHTWDFRPEHIVSLLQATPPEARSEFAESFARLTGKSIVEFLSSNEDYPLTQSTKACIEALLSNDSRKLELAKLAVAFDSEYGAVEVVAHLQGKSAAEKEALDREFQILFGVTATARLQQKITGLERRTREEHYPQSVERGLEILQALRRQEAVSEQDLLDLVRMSAEEIGAALGKERGQASTRYTARIKDQELALERLSLASASAFGNRPEVRQLVAVAAAEAEVQTRFNEMSARMWKMEYDLRLEEIKLEMATGSDNRHMERVVARAREKRDQYLATHSDFFTAHQALGQRLHEHAARGRAKIEEMRVEATAMAVKLRECMAGTGTSKTQLERTLDWGKRSQDLMMLCKLEFRGLTGGDSLNDWIRGEWRLTHTHVCYTAGRRDRNPEAERLALSEVDKKYTTNLTSSEIIKRVLERKPETAGAIALRAGLESGEPALAAREVFENTSSEEERKSIRAEYQELFGTDYLADVKSRRGGDGLVRQDGRLVAIGDTVVIIETLIRVGSVSDRVLHDYGRRRSSELGAGQAEILIQGRDKVNDEGQLTLREIRDDFETLQSSLSDLYARHEGMMQAHAAELAAARDHHTGQLIIERTAELMRELYILHQMEEVRSGRVMNQDPRAFVRTVLQSPDVAGFLPEVALDPVVLRLNPKLARDDFDARVQGRERMLDILAKIGEIRRDNENLFRDGSEFFRQYTQELAGCLDELSENFTHAKEFCDMTWDAFHGGLGITLDSSENKVLDRLENLPDEQRKLAHLIYQNLPRNFGRTTFLRDLNKEVADDSLFGMVWVDSDLIRSERAYSLAQGRRVDALAAEAQEHMGESRLNDVYQKLQGMIAQRSVALAEEVLSNTLVAPESGSGEQAETPEQKRETLSQQISQGGMSETEALQVAGQFQLPPQLEQRLLAALQVGVANELKDQFQGITETTYSRRYDFKNMSGQLDSEFEGGNRLLADAHWNYDVNPMGVVAVTAHMEIESRDLHASVDALEGARGRTEEETEKNLLLVGDATSHYYGAKQAQGPKEEVAENGTAGATEDASAETAEAKDPLEEHDGLTMLRAQIGERMSGQGATLLEALTRSDDVQVDVEKARYATERVERLEMEPRPRYAHAGYAYGYGYNGPNGVGTRAEREMLQEIFLPDTLRQEILHVARDGSRPIDERRNAIKAIVEEHNEHILEVERRYNEGRPDEEGGEPIADDFRVDAKRVLNWVEEQVYLDGIGAEQLENPADPENPISQANLSVADLMAISVNNDREEEVVEMMEHGADADYYQMLKGDFSQRWERLHGGDLAKAVIRTIDNTKATILNYHLNKDKYPPKTIEEIMEYVRFRRDTARWGWDAFHDVFTGSGEEMDALLQEMQAEVGRIEERKRGLFEAGLITAEQMATDDPTDFARLQQMMEAMVRRSNNFLDEKEQIAETVANTAAMVVVIGATLIPGVNIFTWGFVLSAGLVAGAARFGTKATMIGGGYEAEDGVNDALMTGVDIITIPIGAGAGKLVSTGVTAVVTRVPLVQPVFNALTLGTKMPKQMLRGTVEAMTDGLVSGGIYGGATVTIAHAREGFEQGADAYFEELRDTSYDYAKMGLMYGGLMGAGMPLLMRAATVSNKLIIAPVAAVTLKPAWRFVGKPVWSVTGAPVWSHVGAPIWRRTGGAAWNGTIGRIQRNAADQAAMDQAIEEVARRGRQGGQGTQGDAASATRQGASPGSESTRAPAELNGNTGQPTITRDAGPVPSEAKPPRNGKREKTNLSDLRRVELQESVEEAIENAGTARRERLSGKDADGNPLTREQKQARREIEANARKEIKEAQDELRRVDELVGNVPSGSKLEEAALDLAAGERKAAKARRTGDKEGLKRQLEENKSLKERFTHEKRIEKEIAGTERTPEQRRTAELILEAKARGDKALVRRLRNELKDARRVHQESLRAEGRAAELVGDTASRRLREAAERVATAENGVSQGWRQLWRSIRSVEIFRTSLNVLNPSQLVRFADELGDVMSAMGALRDGRRALSDVRRNFRAQRRQTQRVEGAVERAGGDSSTQRTVASGEATDTNTLDRAVDAQRHLVDTTRPGSRARRSAERKLDELETRREIDRIDDEVTRVEKELSDLNSRDLNEMSRAERAGLTRDRNRLRDELSALAERRGRLESGTTYRDLEVEEELARIKKEVSEIQKAQAELDSQDLSAMTPAERSRMTRERSRNNHTLDSLERRRTRIEAGERPSRIDREAGYKEMELETVGKQKELDDLKTRDTSNMSEAELEAHNAIKTKLEEEIAELSARMERAEYGRVAPEVNPKPAEGDPVARAAEEFTEDARQVRQQWRQRWVERARIVRDLFRSPEALRAALVRLSDANLALRGARVARDNSRFSYRVQVEMRGVPDTEVNRAIAERVVRAREVQRSSVSVLRRWEHTAQIREGRNALRAAREATPSTDRGAARAKEIDQRFTSDAHGRNGARLVGGEDLVADGWQSIRDGLAGLSVRDLWRGFGRVIDGRRAIADANRWFQIDADLQRLLPQLTRDFGGGEFAEAQARRAIEHRREVLHAESQLGRHWRRTITDVVTLRWGSIGSRSDELTRVANGNRGIEVELELAGTSATDDLRHLAEQVVDLELAMNRSWFSRVRRIVGTPGVRRIRDMRYELDTAIARDRIGVRQDRLASQHGLSAEDPRIVALATAEANVDAATAGLTRARQNISISDYFAARGRLREARSGLADARGAIRSNERAGERAARLRRQVEQTESGHRAADGLADVERRIRDANRELRSARRAARRNPDSAEHQTSVAEREGKLRELRAEEAQAQRRLKIEQELRRTEGTPELRRHAERVVDGTADEAALAESREALRVARAEGEVRSRVGDNARRIARESESEAIQAAAYRTAQAEADLTLLTRRGDASPEQLQRARDAVEHSRYALVAEREIDFLRRRASTTVPKTEEAREIIETLAERERQVSILRLEISSRRAQGRDVVGLEAKMDQLMPDLREARRALDEQRLIHRLTRNYPGSAEVMEAARENARLHRELARARERGTLTPTQERALSRGITEQDAALSRAQANYSWEISLRRRAIGAGLRREGPVPVTAAVGSSAARAWGVGEDGELVFGRQRRSSTEATQARGTSGESGSESASASSRNVDDLRTEMESIEARLREHNVSVEERSTLARRLRELDIEHQRLRSDSTTDDDDWMWEAYGDGPDGSGPRSGPGAGPSGPRGSQGPKDPKAPESSGNPGTSGADDSGRFAARDSVPSGSSDGLSARDRGASSAPEQAPGALEGESFSIAGEDAQAITRLEQGVQYYDSEITRIETELFGVTSRDERFALGKERARALNERTRLLEGIEEIRSKYRVEDPSPAPRASEDASSFTEDIGTPPESIQERLADIETRLADIESTDVLALSRTQRSNHFRERETLLELRRNLRAQSGVEDALEDALPMRGDGNGESGANRRVDGEGNADTASSPRGEAEAGAGGSPEADPELSRLATEIGEVEAEISTLTRSLQSNRTQADSLRREVTSLQSNRTGGTGETGGDRGSPGRGPARGPGGNSSGPRASSADGPQASLRQGDGDGAVALMEPEVALADVIDPQLEMEILNRQLQIEELNVAHEQALRRLRDATDRRLALQQSFEARNARELGSGPRTETQVETRTETRTDIGLESPRAGSGAEAPRTQSQADTTRGNVPVSRASGTRAPLDESAGASSSRSASRSTSHDSTQPDSAHAQGKAQTQREDTSKVGTMTEEAPAPARTDETRVRPSIEEAPAPMREDLATGARAIPVASLLAALDAQSAVSPRESVVPYQELRPQPYPYYDSFIPLRSRVEEMRRFREEPKKPRNKENPWFWPGSGGYEQDVDILGPKKFGMMDISLLPQPEFNPWEADVGRFVWKLRTRRFDEDLGEFELNKYYSGFEDA